VGILAADRLVSCLPVVEKIMEATMSLVYTQNDLKNYYVSEGDNCSFLDNAHEYFLAGSIREGMNLLIDSLYDLYTSTSTKEWQRLLRTTLFDHPIYELLMEDPLVSRSLNRPRGYAGDAATIDLIYFPNEANLESVSKIGKKLFKFTTSTNIAKALRNRKSILANYIDSISEDNSNSRILSVACGHCRETIISKAFRNEQFGEYIGIDQDHESLNTANIGFSTDQAQTFPLSTIDLLKNSVDLGKFDLIYSAGLYDYLGIRSAQRLTANLYDKLHAGGKLVLFNVVPNFHEIGFFESYMNWSLIGRDTESMLELVNGIPSNEIATCEVGSEKQNAFNYVVITKS